MEPTAADDHLLAQPLRDKQRADAKGALRNFNERLDKPAIGIEALAPPTVRHAFGRVRDAARDLERKTFLDGLDSRPPAAHPEEVERLRSAANEFKTLARDDLDHEDFEHARHMALLGKAIEVASQEAAEGRRMEPPS